MSFYFTRQTVESSSYISGFFNLKNIVTTQHDEIHCSWLQYRHSVRTVPSPAPALAPSQSHSVAQVYSLITSCNKDLFPPAHGADL